MSACWKIRFKYCFVSPLNCRPFATDTIGLLSVSYKFTWKLPNRWHCRPVDTFFVGQMIQAKQNFYYAKDSARWTVGPLIQDQCLSFVRCYLPKLLGLFLEGNIGQLNFYKAGNMRQSHSFFPVNRKNMNFCTLGVSIFSSSTMVLFQLYLSSFMDFQMRLSEFQIF